MIDERCDSRCERMPECAVCHKRKHPRGRDPGMAMANSYCGCDCPGYYDEPTSGHLWPGELDAWRAEEAAELERSRER